MVGVTRGNPLAKEVEHRCAVWQADGVAICIKSAEPGHVAMKLVDFGRMAGTGLQHDIEEPNCGTLQVYRYISSLDARVSIKFST